MAGTRSMEFAFIISADDPGDRPPLGRLEELVDRAKAAQEAGFDHIAVAHRYSIGPATADDRGEPLSTSRLQPLLALAYLARELGDSLGYLTSVLVSPALHPVQLAEEVASLDAMCRGRLSLGVGLGWMPYEFEAFGVRKGQRVKRFEELLTVYRGLLAGKEVTFEGQHFSMHDVRVVARSVQSPRPPLWIGANADPAVRRAARLGDAWIMSAHNTVDDLERLVDLYDDTLAEEGKPPPPDRPVNRLVFVAKDRESALRLAEPELAAWYRRRGKWGWFVTQGSSATDEILHSGRWIIGSPDDCAQQILELRRRLGSTHVVMGMTWPTPDNRHRIETIRLLGSEVLPRVRERLASGAANGPPD